MDVIHIEHPYLLDKKLNDLKALSVAFGNFDGLHAGHQQVISTAINLAKEYSFHSGVLTFHPHPKAVLTANQKVTYLTPLEDKLDLLRKMGVEKAFVIRFTKSFAQLKPLQFIEQYIVNLGVKHVVTGFDFCFGHGGEGTTTTLAEWSKQKNHFQLHVLPSIDDNQEKISSSRIRKLLQAGEIENVSRLLNRNYEISGRVIDGEKRGRQIGFPTANLELKEPYVIPKLGVYAVIVNWSGEEFFGVLNIGLKPTFQSSADTQPTIEVHLFDFQQTIYNHELTIQFIAYLREEQKFASIEHLKVQIEADILLAKQKLKITS